MSKDSKTIIANIGKIKVAGAKLDSMIQATAVDVLTHFTEHRDTGLVNRLYLAMPKGSRGLALADWMLKFMPLKVNTEKDKADRPFAFAKDKATMLTVENIAAGAAVMWYDLKKDKALDEVFDVAVMFKSMLRRIEKSTKVEHFDRPALLAMAKACGIPESDVPTKPSAKSKATVTADDSATDPLAAKF